MIVLLLILSARTPAPEEKIRNGTTKIAPANDKMVFAEAGPFILINR